MKRSWPTSRRRLRRLRSRCSVLCTPTESNACCSSFKNSASTPTKADAGADAIEVGIPFSDPVMDGPTILAASVRALERGTTPIAILGELRDLDVVRNVGGLLRVIGD